MASSTDRRRPRSLLVGGLLLAMGMVGATELTAQERPIRRGRRATSTSGSVCGTKFIDANDNGVWDGGESAADGWEITAVGLDANLQVTGVQQTVVTGHTGTAGEFCFYNLPAPAHYLVQETPQKGFSMTLPANLAYHNVELHPGQSVTGLEFGNAPKPQGPIGGTNDPPSVDVVGQICGRKMLDENGNGVLDPNETTGVGGILISASAGGSSQNVSTQPDGSFCVDVAKFTPYTITESPGAGWIQTAPVGGAFTGTLTTDQLPKGQQLLFLNAQCLAAPQPSALVGWWDFDDPPGSSTARDLAGFPNDGDYGTAGNWMSGKVGTTLVDGHVSIPHHPEIDVMAGDFSIDAWVFAGDGGVIAAKFDQGSPRGFVFTINTQDRLTLVLHDGATLDLFLSPPLSLYPHQWHHVAVTVKRSDPNGVRFYYDGKAIGQPGDPTTVTGSLSTSQPLILGRHFSRLIDELQLYKAVLTPGEIEAIYDAGSLGKCKS